jgi:hypothetical protein
MFFYVCNGLGDSIDNPSREQMETFLRGIDVTDEEHGAAWLAREDERHLEWNGDGRLVFGESGASKVRYLRGVSRERTLELWIALAEGRLNELEDCDWLPGNGYVQTPEHEAETRAWQLKQDRAFYDVLGAERPDVPCRADGCSRGAVELSIFCRPHHFEMVQKRRCPFED